MSLSVCSASASQLANDNNNNGVEQRQEAFASSSNDGQAINCMLTLIWLTLCNCLLILSRADKAQTPLLRFVDEFVAQLVVQQIHNKSN